MDSLPPPDLDTDIEAAVAALDRPPHESKFILPANLFRRRKAEDRRARRGIQKFIRPENADSVIPHLPGLGERTHCILRGDFTLCDLIPAIIHHSGFCEHLRVATLGMSRANADTLASLIERGQLGALTIVVSHYFQQVDRATVFREVAARLRGLARLVVTRSHAKVICLPTPAGAYVIEGSANLRSSDNLEQMLMVNDAETLAFHSAWIDQLASEARDGD